MNKHKCRNCEGNDDFETQLAINRMARKNEQLAEILKRFMEGVVDTSGPIQHSASLENRKILVTNLNNELYRILGGSPTSSYPDCSLIGNRSSNGTIEWFCTGVLIHPLIVLTAGHCFRPNNIPNVVALGTSDQNKLHEAEIISVRRAVVHPRYQQSHRFSDMTALILRGRAITKYVNIASEEELNASSQVTLVGFGNDDINSTKGFGIKREVKVEVISIRRKASDNLDSEEQKFGYESDLEFVAGGRGFDTCNGDSGGPVYILNGEDRKVAGLTSRATLTSTHKCGDGGVYTRLDKHIDFINNTAKDAGIDDLFC